MIYNYVKGITLLAIFLALIEMILPSQKFSKYIKLVLGFVLMVNIVLPFVDLKKYSFELKNFEDLNFTDDTFDYSPYVEASANADSYALGESIKQNIQSGFVSDEYYIDKVYVDYKINGDIVEFNSIDITLGEKENSRSNGEDKNNIEPNVDIVKIEKIEVGGLKKDIRSSADYDENPEILNLKNQISKEYNLSNENIYINIK